MDDAKFILSHERKNLEYLPPSEVVIECENALTSVLSDGELMYIICISQLMRCNICDSALSNNSIFYEIIRKLSRQDMISIIGKYICCDDRCGKHQHYKWQCSHQ